MPLKMEVSENNNSSLPDKTNTEVAQVVNQQTVPTENTTQPKILEVRENLLINLKSVIEIITARGGFRAAELTTVGVLYDQLNNVLSKEK